MNYVETIERMALLEGIIKVLSCNYSLSCFFFCLGKAWQKACCEDRRSII